MNVRVNLLPEARIQKLKNQSKKRTYSAIAGIVGGSILAAVIVFAMLQGFLIATFNINQNRISELNNEIDKSKNIEQQSATLQANLASFSTLNKDRTFASRFFSNFFKARPDYIKIESVSIVADNTVTVIGRTNSFADVSKFANLLEEYNVNYLPQPDLDREPLFTEVDFKSVNREEGSNRTEFEMTFKINQELLKEQAKK